MSGRGTRNDLFRWMLTGAVMLLLGPNALTVDKNARMQKPLRVVRIDEHAPRIFLEESASFAESLRRPAEATRYVERLREWVSQSRPQWNHRWSASIFSDAKYAGYKTDGSNFKDPAWSNAYLAEYSEEESTLKIYPGFPKKIVIVRLKRKSPASP